MKYFFVGVHNLQKLDVLPECCISYLRLEKRQKPIKLNDWLLDSGAFSQVSSYGDYQVSCRKYADAIRKWSNSGNLLAAVTQDYMCEPMILQKCSSTIEEQQRKTIHRYYDLKGILNGEVYLMPVLQGWYPEDYLCHLNQYNFTRNAWVGIGSICRRQNSKELVKIVGAIHSARPDLRLHLFGAKIMALSNPLLHSWIYSADSASWSYAARREKRDRNSVDEAYRFWKRIKEFDSGLFSIREVTASSPTD